MGIILVGGHFYQRTPFPIPKVVCLRESWLYCEKLSPDSVIASHLFVYATTFLSRHCNIVRHKISLCTRQTTRQPFVSHSRSGAFSIQSVDDNFCGLGILLRKPCIIWLSLLQSYFYWDDARASRFFVWKMTGNAEVSLEARTIKIRFLRFAANLVVSIGKMINSETFSYLMFWESHMQREKDAAYGNLPAG